MAVVYQKIKKFNGHFGEDAATSVSSDASTSNDDAQYQALVAQFLAQSPRAAEFVATLPPSMVQKAMPASATMTAPSLLALTTPQVTTGIVQPAVATTGQINIKELLLIGAVIAAIYFYFKSQKQHHIAAEKKDEVTNA